MDELNDLDEIFDDIEKNEGVDEAAGGFKEIEDGEYEAEVIGAEFGNSKKTNARMVTIEYGLEDSRHKWQYLMLDGKDDEQTRRNIATFVTTMKKFGLEAKNIKGYISQLESLEGRRCTLVLTTTKSGFQRVSVTPHD